MIYIILIEHKLAEVIAVVKIGIDPECDQDFVVWGLFFHS